MDKIKENILYAKESKCSFGHKYVEYLGHVISEAGVATYPEKIKCIVNWPSPKNLKELRGILGLISYYMKFIRGYALICKPLYDLLRKDAFHLE